MLCHSEWHATCLSFSHPIIFMCSILHQLEWLANLQQSPIPLQFPLPDVVIATDATPTHWAFYFQGSGLPLLVSGSWSCSLCRAHIALQELQAVAMMLHRMAFHLSGKVVALHLDNSTVKAYLCNQDGTVCPFLSRLACQILSLTDKYDIILTSAYIPTHHNVEADYLSWDWLLLEWHLLLQVAQAAFALGPSRGGPNDIFSFYSMLALFHLGKSTTSGGLWVECLQSSLDFSGKLYVSSSSSSSVHISCRTCQWSTETFDSGGTMLDGDSLASHSSQHVGRCSFTVSHYKRSCCGCFGRPGIQGCVISACNPLAAQQCVLCRQGFSSSFCQAVAGATQTSTSKVYQKCWKEWAGWCAQQGLLNNAISAPKLANFLLHVFQVGLAWCNIGIYHSAMSAFLDPHQLHKASNHPIIAKLMHHFYLQCPPSHKCFDPWDVEHLLSLGESWAPASSLTTFKLAWKTATLLVLVTAKCCSDLTLSCIDNQHFFLRVMLPFSFPCLAARLIIQIIFPFRFVLSLAPMLIFALFFILKAYLRCTESFNHFFVLLKHMSPGSLWGVAASAALAASISLVTIL